MKIRNHTILDSRIVINNCHPRVVTHWVRNDLLVLASGQPRCRYLSSSPLRSPKIFRMSNKGNPSNTDSGVEFFKQFSQNPKEVDIETVQGSHKFLSLVLAQKVSSSIAKKSTLIRIFNHFIDEPVKDYVFHRISRKLLLELAIRILQEFITRGVQRARTLKLVVADATSSEEKTILIAPNDASNGDNNPYQAPEVLDATFRLSDTAGLSPDVSFSIGKKRPPAFQRPDSTGYFTPSKKGARKALDFKVQFTPKSLPPRSAKFVANPIPLFSGSGQSW